MKSIEIKLYAAMPGGTNKFTYKHNGRFVDVYRVFDKPHGYIYFNYKSRTLGSFTITRVINRYGVEQHLGFVLPQDDVINFFVYYAYNFDHPLMICIASMKKKSVITYRYFTPMHKNSNRWNEETEIVVDPKWSANMNKIKQKLDETFSIMGGIEIHIDETQDNKKHNIVTEEYPFRLQDYRIYTHELKTKMEFILNRIRCNGEIIPEIEFKNPVLAVHVVSRNHNYFKPIILCVVESANGKNGENLYHWYSLDNLDSNKWIKRHQSTTLLESTDVEHQLNILCNKFHEFDMDLNNIFFNSRQHKDYTNNGELFKEVQQESTGYGFSRHICELKIPFPFKVNTMNIYGTKQTGLPVEMYHKFHVYWHEKNDPYIPVIFCAELKGNNYRWYHVKHFASNEWIEYPDLEGANPDDNDVKEDFEKIYQSLFWIDLDIDYNKTRELLKQYNKNDRYIDTRETTHKLFKRVEIVNFSSYPLAVKIYLDGKKQRGIPETNEVLSVHIFYYNSDKKTLPMFICFDMYYYYNDFRWYSRHQENTDLWSENKDLKNVNPNDFNFEILKTVQEGVYLYQLDEKLNDQNISVQNVTGKAVGASFGAAACCGVGYLVYTNAGTILNFFR